jgi:hypothetical protein
MAQTSPDDDGAATAAAAAGGRHLTRGRCAHPSLVTYCCCWLLSGSVLLAEWVRAAHRQHGGGPASVATASTGVGRQLQRDRHHRLNAPRPTSDGQLRGHDYSPADPTWVHGERARRRRTRPLRQAWPPNFKKMSSNRRLISQLDPMPKGKTQNQHESGYTQVG